MFWIVEPFDRYNVMTAALGGEQDAGVYRLAIEQDRAHTAFALEAILFGAAEAEIGAQHAQQRPVRLDHYVVLLAVNPQEERQPAHGVPSIRLAQRARARVVSTWTRWRR